MTEAFTRLSATDDDLCSTELEYLVKGEDLSKADVKLRQSIATTAKNFMVLAITSNTARILKGNRI